MESTGTETFYALFVSSLFDVSSINPQVLPILKGLIQDSSLKSAVSLISAVDHSLLHWATTSARFQLSKEV